ncbi:MAG TPA: SDR family oxidoreductase [Acidimicrobiia bacterium]|jgi:NAD(P)-dependent dehydrogenase (short-subunit alcohol dehydrogenase family)
MTIDLGLTGKRALVTGAAVGIGRGIARWLAAAGCDVVIADKDTATLAEAADEVAGAGTKVVAATADLRDPDAVRALVARMVVDLGGIDIAVNNVGSLAGRMPAAFVDLDDDALRDVVEQNLFVTMWSCHAEARAMVAAGTEGVIVNVTSGETTRPSLRMAHYGAAKAAVNHLTETLAVELAPHGIRVLAVAPGTTLTPVVAAALSDEQVAALVDAHPLGRLGEPDDLGRLVVALASDLGRSVTGQVVFGDNGAQLSRNRPAL